MKEKFGNTIDFCLFHIEKCAGSSLRSMLHEYFKNIYDTQEIFLPEKYKNEHNLMNENDLAFIKQNDFKVLLCHCNFNQPGVTDLFSKTCFSITCVRDPFSRSLSHYYHFIRNDNRAFSDLTNDEILSIIPRIAPNLLTSRLSGFQDNIEIALQNVKHINCILIFENLKNDIISLNNILNDVTHSKVKLNMAFRNVRSSYSEKDYARIKQFHQYFQNDILLYNTIVKMGAKNRFRIKC